MLQNRININCDISQLIKITYNVFKIQIILRVKSKVAAGYVQQEDIYRMLLKFAKTMYEVMNH